jgi:hypothetical protein
MRNEKVLLIIIYSMVKVRRYPQMEIYMKESILMDRDMEKQN